MQVDKTKPYPPAAQEYFIPILQLNLILNQNSLILLSFHYLQLILPNSFIMKRFTYPFLNPSMNLLNAETPIYFIFLM